MKGLIFTEFMEMVEGRWGLDMLDAMLLNLDLKSDGIYTSVDNYDSAELFALIGLLAKDANLPVRDVVNLFGSHLANAFVNKFPEFFKGTNSLFDVLKNVDNHIHVEVKKLYPDAVTPTFSFTQPSADTLILRYHSKRNLADLAQGIIEGCASFFNENISISRQDTQAELGFESTFVIQTDRYALN